jgi:hypothetical protein
MDLLILNITPIKTRLATAITAGCNKKNEIARVALINHTEKILGKQFKIFQRHDFLNLYQIGI